MDRRIVFGVVILGVFLLTGCSKNYTAFAQCLAENDATMYGTYRCSHCKNQKEMFGPAFFEVQYVECDANGPNGDPDLCKEKGITGYPTWIISGSKVLGEVPLEKLSKFTGCALP